MIRYCTIACALIALTGCATTGPSNPEPATLRVMSDPPGAFILQSTERDGPWDHYRKAEGLHVTPSTSLLVDGEFFWLKLRLEGYRETAPQFVRAAGGEPIEIDARLEQGEAIDVTKSAPATRVSIATTPAGATVLVSNDEFGRYEPWPPGNTAITPIEARVDRGQRFWMKLRKDGFMTTDPVYLTVTDEPIDIKAVLTPAPTPQTPQPQSAAAADSEEPPGRDEASPAPGVVATGFAIDQGNPGAARQAAILDALSAALQETYGARIASTSVAENFILKENRIESLVEKRFAQYDVLEESRGNGLYRVVLRVLFAEDLLDELGGENLKALLMSDEIAHVEGRYDMVSYTRAAVADALMGARLQVTIDDEADFSYANLALAAKREQADLGLYVRAETDLRDKFGSFYSYQTAVEYRLLMPETGDVVAEGSLTALNEERPLTADEAARQSLEAAGKAVAAELLQKLAERYERAAAHTIFISGITSQRHVEAIVAELATLSGVRNARLVARQSDLCEIALIVAPDVRPGIASAVQRIRNADLDIVEGDLYATVATVR